MKFLFSDLIQSKCSPPSSVIICPVKEGESRMNSTALEISFGEDPLPSGTDSLWFLKSLLDCLAPLSVGPGPIAQTLIFGLNAWANTFVSHNKEFFDDEYEIKSGLGKKTLWSIILIIIPGSFFGKSFANDWDNNKGALVLTLLWISHDSIVRLFTESSSKTDALFTNRVSFPNFFSDFEINSFVAFGLLRLALIIDADPPFFCISFWRLKASILFEL